ncbi:MAG: ABC transporter permease [Bacteroidales bacterium]|jgi:ABC-2 type transport system permease protein|nr:ABC transporter permease [Bacteroidales bacterium]
MFLSFVKKEFLHIFRDPRTMLITLGMPVAQIILFGFAITTEVKNVRMAVFDPSHDISTQRIISRMQASEYFDMTQVLHTADDINSAFNKGTAELVVVFSDRFDENLLRTGKASVQLIADATDPNRAAMLTGYASNIIADYQQELLREHRISFLIEPEIQMLYNPQMKSAYNFVPGVMGLILTLICAMMTSIAIVREKEVGTMEVLLVSPVRPVWIILAKVAPYFTLSIVNIISILLLSVFVLDVPVSGSMFWLAVVALMFIIVALLLGIVISSVATTQVTAMLVSGMLLMMPVLLLSGMIFPIENMPVILQWISNIIPARWFITAVRKVMIEGLGVSYVAKELAILAGMAIFLIAVSVKTFKIRLS